jgi:hypothetical protein
MVLVLPPISIAVHVMLSGFVMADGASDHSAENAVMTGIVAGDSADESSFNAASSIRWAWHGNRGNGQRETHVKRSHDDTRCD